MNSPEGDIRTVVEPHKGLLWHLALVGPRGLTLLFAIFVVVLAALIVGLAAFPATKGVAGSIYDYIRVWPFSELATPAAPSP